MQEAARLQATSSSSTQQDGSEQSFKDSETALRRALLMERVENNNNNNAQREGAAGGGPTCVFQMLNIDPSIAGQLRASLKANGERFDGDDDDDEDGDDRRRRHHSGATSPKNHRGTTTNKGGSKHPTAGGTSTATATTAARKINVKQIHIPLTGGMDRLRLTDMKSALKDEYAARYCESLGVAPTPQNTALVQKLMPFEKCRVYQSTLNVGGRGERRNQIVIEPAPLPTEPIGGGRGPEAASSMLEALLEAEADDEDHHEKDNLKVGQTAGIMSASGQQQQQDSATMLLQQAMQFDEYKSKFVFPFCLPNKFESHVVMDEPEARGPLAATAKKSGATNSPPAMLLPSLPGGGVEKSGSRGAGKAAAAAAGVGVGAVAGKLAMQDHLLQQALSGGSSSSLPLSTADRKAVEAIMKTSEGSDRQAGVGRQVTSATSSTGGSSIHRCDDTTPASGRGGPAPPSSSGSPATTTFGFSDREAVDATIRKELNINLSEAADPTDVKLMQQQFVRHFPFARYDGRLTAAEVQRAKGLTLSSSVSNILVSLLRFLWSVYIGPFNSSKYAADGKTTDQLFLDTYKQVLMFSNDTMKQQHSSSSTSGTSNASSSAEMSLFLLCVRVVVDAWFSVRMPTFSQCSIGKSVLQRMDHFVMALVDPMGLLSHIAVVESTPAALKVMRSRKLPDRVHGSVTSPLVLFIIGDSASSHEAKKFAHAKPQCVEDGLKELKRYLTPFVRSQLLRTITDEKLHAQH